METHNRSNASPIAYQMSTASNIHDLSVLNNSITAIKINVPNVNIKHKYGLTVLVFAILSLFFYKDGWVM